MNLPGISLRILLVEDNPTDVLFMEEALEGFPTVEFVLTHVDRLDQAMICLRSGSFDAVLLDLGLPDSQGLDTFIKLQRQYGAVPILVLSGLDDNSVAIRAVQDGAQDYLVKGKINSSMLSRTIRYAIERKRVEQKLVASEIGHRRLFEAAQDGIFILDAGTGQIIDANPALELMLGYKQSEMKGKRLWEIGPFRDKAASQAAFRTLQNIGYIRYEDLPLGTRDGRVVDVEFVSNVYLVEDKKVIQCNVRDITERKQAVAAAQEAQRALQSTVDALRSHIAVLNEDGIILAVNQAWRQFSEENGGTPVACGVGANYLEVCDRAVGEWSEEAPLFAQGIRDVIQGLCSSYCLEYPCHSPGEQRWFSGCVTRFSGDGPVRVVLAHENITERRQAEEVQHISEARLQSMMANAPGTVYQYLLKPDGSVEIPFVNDGCRELLEIEPDELRRNPTFPTSIIHPEDSERFECSVNESASSLQPWASEWRVKLPSGTEKWVQGAARPQRTPDGGTLWDGLLTDITARKEAEEDRDRFFTLSLDILCIVNPKGYFSRLNPAVSALVGFSNAELMGRPFTEFIHPDDVPATLREVDQLAGGGSTINFENRCLCRDGSYKWLTWTVAPYNGSLYCAGHDITAIKEGEDALRQSRDEMELKVVERTAELKLSNFLLQSEITERQRAEESLYKNHEFLKAVLENATEGIIACDAVGALTLSNRATREFYGLLPEAANADQLLFARRSNVYLSDGTTPMEQNQLPLDRALAGERVRNAEMVIAPRNGPARIVISSGDPLSTVDGKKMGAVVLMHDVTVARQHEQELRLAKEEAEAANLAKSEFLSRMSHELRTPLNAILGFGQILEMQESKPAALESIEHILKGGRHLLGLINEVLDISTIEAGRMDISLEPVNLARLAGEVLDLVRPLAVQRNVQLISELQGRDDLHLLADQQRFKQLLINLLSNAVKYNRENGRVIISCTPAAANPESHLRIAVSDTGPGLSEDEISRIFTPFERLDAARSGIEGTGIGLALCKRLAGAMNGSIGVESIPGQGSTFWLEFPAAESPEAVFNDIVSEAVTPTVDQQPGHSILYIEDNLSNLRVVEMVLANFQGVQLLSAMQGSVGIDLAKLHHPDLILLDLHLPDMMGDEVLRRLRANSSTSHIPVVMLSADATLGQIERLRAAGATDYLTKPLNLKHFLSVIKEILLASEHVVAVG